MPAKDVIPADLERRLERGYNARTQPVVGEFGAAWSRRHAVEHPGVAVRATTIDPRMMRCNVNIEIGSRFGTAVKRTATGLR